MNKLILALAVLPFLAVAGHAQNGAPDPAAGKALWEGNDSQCKNCHGKAGEGGFGPDLAGRGLSAAQFHQAVRTPWGVMPAFIDSQVSDGELADLAAYFLTLPKTSQLGAWRVPLAADQPMGQQLFVAGGCAQCHGADAAGIGLRATLGAVDADFAQFAKLVYDHTGELPKFDAMLAANRPPAPERQGPGGGPRRLHMGNFNRLRLSEPELQEIYNWMRNDIGFRPSLQARLNPDASRPATYTLTLTNNGLKGKGRNAEGVVIDLAIPAGLSVVSATGDGYKGVHMDAQSSANVAEWQLKRLNADPTDIRTYTITLSGPATTENALKGTVRWAKPAPKTGPNLDVVNIAPVPSPPRGGSGPQARP